MLDFRLDSEELTLHCLRKLAQVYKTARSTSYAIATTTFIIIIVGTDQLVYEQERPFPEETINYNERFRWGDTWRQGRLDFGIFGGQFNQEYRQAKYRGMPYPIAWVAEHFTLDGEQILWYRKFRVAGWYTHIWLW